MGVKEHIVKTINEKLEVQAKMIIPKDLAEVDLDKLIAEQNEN